MKQLSVGEIIKKHRKQINLTQEELCYGICDVSTLSRIERGTQTPSYPTLQALLERMNLPGEKYYAMLSENELEIEQLKDEIVDCNTRKLYKEGLQKIDSLSKLVETDDRLTQQFILRSKVLLGKMENSKHSEYSFDEKLSMLYQAIRLTIPHFDIDDIGSRWYSLDEMKIINQMAITFIENGKYRPAIDVYYQMMKYINRKFNISSDNVSVAIMISYNYSLVLSKEKRYEEAIEIATWGWNKCIDWGRCGALAGLLFVIGKCLYFTDKAEESKEYMIQSYIIYKSLRNTADAKAVREDIKEYFGLEI